MDVDQANLTPQSKPRRPYLQTNVPNQTMPKLGMRFTSSTENYLQFGRARGSKMQLFRLLKQEIQVHQCKMEHGKGACNMEQSVGKEAAAALKPQVTASSKRTILKPSPSNETQGTATRCLLRKLLKSTSISNMRSEQPAGIVQLILKIP